MNIRTVLGIIVALILVGGAAYAIINRKPDVGPAVRPVELSDLGIRITVPAILSDLATEPLMVPRLGTVLSMQASSIEGTVPGRGCELGVMYYVPKSHIETVGLDEADIQARTQGTLGAPPQAKEFENAYFIFEPSQATCSTDEAEKKEESDKRYALWQSVSTAEEIPTQ